MKHVNSDTSHQYGHAVFSGGGICNGAHVFYIYGCAIPFPPKKQMYVVTKYRQGVR